MRTLLLAILLTACTDESTPGECPVPLEACGNAPTHPGMTVAFDGDSVTMSRVTYDGIVKWQDDMAVWRDCIADL